MFNPSNALNDPTKASRSDYLGKDGKPDTSYRYQTSEQFKGTSTAAKVPENAKNLLSGLKIPKK